MDVIYKNCCGIDVHKTKLVCCLLKGRKQEIKEFRAETKEIRAMSKWLLSQKCEMIAMESTACYWKPLVNIFEEKGLSFMIINAKDYKNVPGRKTDVADSEWIADLLKHGLLKSSYIPTREQRELREATRYRKSITEERARAYNRLQKMLEGANIKITSILSNVKGKSCRSLIEYVLEHEEAIDDEIAAQLVKPNISATIEEVVNAMDGIITPFQKKLMKEVLKHIDELTTRISDMDKMIDEYMKDYEDNIKKLEQIPGIKRKTAQVILAEIGQDMSRFPTACHLASWAGVSPGNNESAGKRRSGKTRKGNKILKSTLARAAKGACKDKESFYYAQCQRLTVRKGKNKATMAVAHSMLISIYHILKDDVEYIDLGANFYNQFNTEKKIKSYLKKLDELGWDGTIPDSIFQEVHTQTT